MFKIARMKKTFLLLLVTVVASSVFIYTSCKKVTHGTNPTPDNYRLLSYTKVTTQSIIAPPTPTPIITENYRFLYDGSKRVSQIFFTSNDSNKVHAGMSNLSIKFSYNSDSIYKISTDLNTSSIREQDTFIINSFGQITNAYFPTETHSFTYFGSILASEIVSFRDSGTSINANLTYTADHGDFFNRIYDGNLTVTFPDSGIVPYTPPPPYVFRDTFMVLPLDVTWTVTPENGTAAIINHNGISGYTDGISGYFQDAITVNAVDQGGNYVRTGYFPAGYAAKQYYQFYEQQANRTGDYMQIESFTTYGINIYPNQHMVYSMQSPYNTTNVVYNIDADSKVTQITASVKDSLLQNVTNLKYSLQYETD